MASAGRPWLRIGVLRSAPAAPAAARQLPGVTGREEPAPGSKSSTKDWEKDQDEQVASGGLAEAHLEVSDIVGRVQMAAAGIEDVIGQRPLDTLGRARHECDRGDPEDGDEQCCGDPDAQPGGETLAGAGI